MENEQLTNIYTSPQAQPVVGADAFIPSSPEDMEDLKRIRREVDALYKPLTDAVRESQGISWRDLIIRINS